MARVQASGDEFRVEGRVEGNGGLFIARDI